jgi:hypothetical protein
LKAGAAPGVHLEILPPVGAAPELESSLPAFELGPLSGARVTLRAGYSGEFGLLRIACATAPSKGYAPGVEDLIFGRATQIERSVLADVVRLDAAPPRATANGFEQRLEGEAMLDAVRSRVVARHLLAFTEGGSGAVVCSVACVERVANGCASSIDQAKLEGALASPPPPSFVTTALFAGVENPVAASSAFAIAFVAIAWFWIARRPRSRRLA